VLEGSLTLEDAATKIEALTRQYAKRQITWLHKEPEIRLLDAGRKVSELTDEIVSIVGSFEGG
jgi:tRNA A37 N6-isopentenylltransferase MiaA